MIEEDLEQDATTKTLTWKDSPADYLRLSGLLKTSSRAVVRKLWWKYFKSLLHKLDAPYIMRVTTATKWTLLNGPTPSLNVF